MPTFPKICIVGLKCYDLLSRVRAPRYIGGIENQLVHLARGLAERGFPVSFVTYDHGQPDGIVHDGIHVYKAFASDEGIRFLRFVHPRWTKINYALSRADADIYYQMGAGCETGQVALWCRKRQKPFVFATASDADCVPELPLLASRRERYLFRYGLKNSNLVLVQTQKQRNLLVKHQGICSEQLGVSIPKPSHGTIAPEKRNRMLWVGRISPEKRPHLLLEIARRLPKYALDVIGDSNNNSAYAEDFRNTAHSLSSIVLHGKVSEKELQRAYDEAILMLGTSETEGFPITFIEAWSRGIPVVSTFDPDNVIRDNSLGVVAQDVNEIVSGVKRLVQSRSIWEAASKAAKQYYLANHTPEVYLSKLERLLLEIAGYGRLKIACGIL